MSVDGRHRSFPHPGNCETSPTRGSALLSCTMLLLALLNPIPAHAQTVLLPETALVRIIHASPDAPALDVYLDDQLLTVGAVFGSVTEYLSVTSGKHNLQVVPAGGTPMRQSLVTTEVSFEPETLQFVAIQNFLNAIALAVYPEDVSEINGQGYSRIRMIHLVPDANGISLLVSDGEELFDSVVPLTATRYEDIQAGSHNLTIRAERQDVLAAIPVALALLPNVSYDLVVLGQIGSRSIQILPLVTATEQPCGQFLGIGGPDSGCLRFVNASPEIPTVDLYIGDDSKPVASGLPFGVVSPVISLPSGDVSVRIVPTGASPAGSLAETSLFTQDGNGFLLIATGPADHAKLDDYDDRDSPLGGQQARVSVIHEAGDAGTVDVAANAQPLVRAILESEQSDDRLTPAGIYVFAATSNPDGTPLSQGEPVMIAAGSSNEIVLIGNTDIGVVAIVVASQAVPTDTTVPAP